MKRLPDQRPSDWGLAILRGLGGKTVYPGTASDKQVARRRAANRIARRSRRVNRRTA